MQSYHEFLAGKAVAATARGLQEVPRLAPHLFHFQAACVEFGLRAGSWACFLSTGLGKTACELEWSRYAAEASNGYALILTPLAVARQIEAEGKRWAYDVRVIREQDEARPGINVCNYDRLDRLDPDAFGAVALDESSILKAMMGKTTRALISTFGRHRWRMAATATPAPNDHMELGNHSEFLGVMPMADMLVRWFLNDTSDTGTWRLKGHAVEDFWDWVASWARMAQHPRDLGEDRRDFDLPPMKIHRHYAEASNVGIGGGLFGHVNVSATEMFQIKRATAHARAAIVADLVNSDREPWLVWCDTNEEGDALRRAIGPDAHEVRGSDPVERKEDMLAGFCDGSVRVLVTKPSIAGHGLNFQHCASMVFVGRTFSYELWFQAVRRCWRFGQKRQVNVHVCVADGEDAIGRVIDRKADDHATMTASMARAMKRAMGRESTLREPYNPTHDGRLPAWLR